MSHKFNLGAQTPGPLPEITHVQALVQGLCAEVLDMDLLLPAAQDMAEERLTEALLALRAQRIPAVPSRPILINHREGNA